jgi:hypothetical protein
MKYLKSGGLTAALAFFLLAGTVNGLEPERLPSLMDSLRFRENLQFCGEPVPMHRPEIRERLEKELLLTLWRRPQVILWLKRSSRYLPYIESELRQRGLPDDLKYIAIIESALRPHARSPKGALGFWQFIRPTGEKYGLRVDQYRDERRSLFASSHAAMDYLTFLYGDLGNWALACAAYNMGEDGLKAEVLAQETRDYYQLHLPDETQRYIFRAIAAKLVMNDPEKYGFQVHPADRYPPMAFDVVEISCDLDTDLMLAAKAAETTFQEIKRLNPDILGHVLPKGEHRILVPSGRGKDFQARFARLYADWSTGYDERIYRVQKGDSLSSIADHFGIPLQSILIWNRIRPNAVIHPGDRLIIYHNGTPPAGRL